MTEQDIREYFEERAAIREFDGGESREDAEAKARRETQVKYGAERTIKALYQRKELAN